MLVIEAILWVVGSIFAVFGLHLPHSYSVLAQYKNAINAKPYKIRENRKTMSYISGFRSRKKYLSMCFWGLLWCILIAGCDTQNRTPMPTAVTSDIQLAPVVTATAPMIPSEEQTPEYTFEMQRIEIPWWGPIVDYTGLTSPIQVGDVDRDGHNELIINLPALEDIPFSDWDEGIVARRQEKVIKLFEWDVY